MNNVLNLDGPCYDYKKMATYQNVEPHELTSKRYSLVNTANIVQLIESNTDYRVCEWREPTAQKRSRFGKGKHIVKLMRNVDKERVFNRRTECEQGDAVAPQICLVNSYDGTSPITISMGMLRLVCLNGLMEQDSTMTVKMRHSGLDYDALAAFLNNIGEHANAMFAQADKMRALPVEPLACHSIVKDALELSRPGLLNSWDAQGMTNDFINNRIDTLANYARRPEDKVNTAWNVFNRVQETLLNKFPAFGMRAVTSIDRNVKLNQFLWGEFASLAQAV